MARPKSRLCSVCGLPCVGIKCRGCYNVRSFRGKKIRTPLEAKIDTGYDIKTGTQDI